MYPHFSLCCLFVAWRSIVVAMKWLCSWGSGRWEIPVEVRREGGPHAPTAIFIDKPLMPRAMTLRRKHERLYKHALVSLASRAAHFATSSNNRRQSPCPDVPAAADGTSAGGHQECGGAGHQSGSTEQAAAPAKQTSEQCVAPAQETKADAACAAGTASKGNAISLAQGGSPDFAAAQGQSVGQTTVEVTV